MFLLFLIKYKLNKSVLIKKKNNNKSVDLVDPLKVSRIKLSSSFFKDEVSDVQELKNEETN